MDLWASWLCRLWKARGSDGEEQGGGGETAQEEGGIRCNQPLQRVGAKNEATEMKLISCYKICRVCFVEPRPLLLLLEALTFRPETGTKPLDRFTIQNSQRSVGPCALKP